LVLTLSVWAIAACAMLAVRYSRSRSVEILPFYHEAKAFYRSLDPETKRNVDLFETGIMRLKDVPLRPVGSGFEQELNSLVSKQQLSYREIDFYIDDPLLVERRIMAAEAFRTLNNAEKKCLIDGSGAIVFFRGSFHFIYDTSLYREYALRYGTDCKPCEEIRSSQRVSQGAKNE
jgi:hypothetical protein